MVRKEQPLLSQLLVLTMKVTLVLYFVSDRSGKGGLDIFYAKANNDGTYGVPQNAGPEVNTAGNDITPFYDAKNKTLYFLIKWTSNNRWT
jgi:hypothetical protein